jgi:Flp pilus assembly protein TadD
MARTRELSADELAALEEERTFLLRSLDDLEEEHAAGDVDEQDYTTLRDDYTARAAKVIRTIERHQARDADPEASRVRWRRIAIAAGIVVFALLAGTLVAQASGRRTGSDSITGNIRETSRTEVDQALELGNQGKWDEGIALLDKVIDKAPDNVEAVTYKGWFQAQSGDPAHALVTLVDANDIDPSYPPLHAFLAVVFERLGKTDYARKELQKLDTLDPPPIILQLVEPLRERLDQPSGSSTTTTAAP